jgi:hypothetical protein
MIFFLELLYNFNYYPLSSTGLLFDSFKASLYRVILSVLDPRKSEYLKDYSVDFEHAYMDSGGEHFQHLF